jgi:hypothetical protein
MSLPSDQARSSQNTQPLGQPDNTLAEEELVSSLSWLIRLRWFAGIGALLATWFSASILDINVRAGPLYLLGLGLLAYNALLWWGLKRLNADPYRPNTVYQWFARAQIGLDWIAMALLIHCSGGIESPAIFYFLFYIAIASLLLPLRHPGPDPGWWGRLFRVPRDIVPHRVIRALSAQGHTLYRGRPLFLLQCSLRHGLLFHGHLAAVAAP